MSEFTVVKSPQRSEAGLIPVLFGRRWKNYWPGDVAGFGDETAVGLVKTGTAQFVEAARPAAKK